MHSNLNHMEWHNKHFFQTHCATITAYLMQVSNFFLFKNLITNIWTIIFSIISAFSNGFKETERDGANWRSTLLFQRRWDGLWVWLMLLTFRCWDLGLQEFAGSSRGYAIDPLATVIFLLQSLARKVPLPMEPLHGLCYNNLLERIIMWSNLWIIESLYHRVFLLYLLGV